MTTKDEIRDFLLTSLRAMRYDTSGIDDDTALGPTGANLESLAVAELSVRVEDHFGVTFEDEEAEQLAAMTISELSATVAARVQPASTPGR